MADELTSSRRPGRCQSSNNHLPERGLRQFRAWSAGCAPTSLGRIKIPNDFRGLRGASGASSKLYVTACDLDSAERVIFGSDEFAELSIVSQCRPGLVGPSDLLQARRRIDGVDYVDGGVRHTANLDVAIDKGADLIICYNPFRPFRNRIDADDGDASYFAEAGGLPHRPVASTWCSIRSSEPCCTPVWKLGHPALPGRRSTSPGDIVLLEPRDQDADFFAINPAGLLEVESESIRARLRVRSRAPSSRISRPAAPRCSTRYGLELDSRAALRKARRLRRTKALDPHRRSAAPRCRSRQNTGFAAEAEDGR